VTKDETVKRTRRVFLQSTAAATALLPFLGAPLRAFAATVGDAGIKIGVIGSGRLGGTVGSLWVKAGHPVMFSSRHPDELKGLVDGLGSLARAGTPQEAAAFGDVVLIAVPYTALAQIGRDYSRELSGKVVLDACNAIAARDGEALAAEVQQKGVGLASKESLPGVRLVRAFNSVGSVALAREAHRADDPIAIPLASDDPGALNIALNLVRDAGFEPVVVGPLARAKDFAVGTSVFGQALTAKELKSRLGMAQ
jgi:8-hydroxy-5-deazaflavin:NADPH oxidoreductase